MACVQVQCGSVRPGAAQAALPQPCPAPMASCIMPVNPVGRPSLRALAHFLRQTLGEQAGGRDQPGHVEGIALFFYWAPTL